LCSHGLTVNKPQLVSFFVYRRQSWDRFRIDNNVNLDMVLYTNIDQPLIN